MSEEIPQQNVFQRNYDKETQHEIEVGFSDMTGRVTGYCRQAGVLYITENNAVAAVMAKVSSLIQKCKQLYIKYHENTRQRTVKGEDGKETKISEISPNYARIVEFEDKMTATFAIDAGWLLKSLKLIQDGELNDIAVRHKLMDRTTEYKPWENEVKKNSF